MLDILRGKKVFHTIAFILKPIIYLGYLIFIIN